MPAWSQKEAPPRRAACARPVRALEEDAVRHQAGLEEVAVLRVSIEFTDSEYRSVDISWSLSPEAAAHKRLECARVFLIALDGTPARTYLDIVDTHPRASVRLPGGLSPGEYAVEIDAYGSSSWGDGRLDAHGRSPSFTL
ncbi:hypothetical protein AB0N05_15685 [Nocardia sp. NPDC051030]|uniref:hypothetical protein n=1 Tax=Nocardia sp. NPDC051030 TaxID=3155162 RepID=UPI003438FF6C